MTQSKEPFRFRANPVELFTLAVISGLFCQSLYRLFYESRDFTPAALKPMAANPISEFPRTPASGATSFSTIEVPCALSRNGPQDQEITAEKIRLAGFFCGMEGITAGAQLSKIAVLNSANQFGATVSLDMGSSKFTTDFIPLAPGKNPIHLEFFYSDGKTVTQDLSFSRN